MQIDIEGLLKEHGERFNLRVPELHVQEGECIGLVGNNGAGKTTFIRQLLDLDQPTAGTIRIDGHLVASSVAWRGETASFLDRSFLLDFLTPLEFWQYVGGLYGRTPEEVETFIPFFQGFIDPTVIGRKAPYIRDLSLGNQKKVGIVASLIAAPRLLVLDEPFANLDPGSQLRLRQLLQQQSRDLGNTLLVSSHDLHHVTEVCTRILLIENGRIVRDVPTSSASLNELEDYFAQVM